MKNKYIFLRHAETVRTPEVASVDWPLTTDGLEKINEYIANGEFIRADNKVTKIYASTEDKAIATVKPIAESLNLPIETLENFIELKREKKFLTDEEFADQKKRELINREQIENGVESANVALDRFVEGINLLEEKYFGEKILICSHGTILTLYFCHLLNDFSTIYERFSKVNFCAIGEVENGKIIKDIV